MPESCSWRQGISDNWQPRTHSAGAAVWLEKPVTQGIIDDNWDMIMETFQMHQDSKIWTGVPEDVDEIAKRDDEEVAEVSTAMPLPPSQFL